jgi:hypothetical protein
VNPAHRHAPNGLGGAGPPLSLPGRRRTSHVRSIPGGRNPYDLARWVWPEATGRPRSISLVERGPRLLTPHPASQIVSLTLRAPGRTCPWIVTLFHPIEFMFAKTTCSPSSCETPDNGPHQQYSRQGGHPRRTASCSGAGRSSRARPSVSLSRAPAPSWTVRQRSRVCPHPGGAGRQREVDEAVIRAEVCPSRPVPRSFPRRRAGP